MSFQSFYKITLDDMKEYILANANNEETKSAFKKALYPTVKKTVLRPVYDEYGNPKMKYSEKKKEWYALQKRVVIENAPEESKFSLVSGKLWFVDNFKDKTVDITVNGEPKTIKIGSLTPNKEKKKKEDEPKKTDFLKEW